MQDITERKKAEEALEESEERYRELVENALDIIYTHDLEGNYTSANKAAETVFGYSNAEILAMNIADTLSPKQLDRARSMMAEEIAGAKIAPYELDIHAKDGHGITVEVSTRVIYENDIPVGIQGIARDITERKQVEGELASSEARLRLALQAARLGTYDWDVPTNHIEWSRWHEELWGYARGEFDGTYKAFSDRVHPDDLAETEAKIEQCMATRERFGHEFRVVWPDNSVHWVAATGEFEFDGDSKPIRMLGAVMDITDRNQAEAALRASEERLRMLFEQMKDGFYYSTPEGKLLDVNPAMVEMFGYSSREEMLAVDVKRDLYFSPEERQSQTLDYGKDESEVYRMRRKDGSEIWVEDRGQYEYDDEGNIEFHQGLLRDVTERKLAEEKLSKSEEQYRDLVENAYDMIYTGEMYGNNTSINAAGEKMTGYSREEFLQLNMSQIVVPEHLDLAKEKIAQKFAGNEGHSYETDILAKDGRRIALEVNTRIIFRDGVAVGVQGIARDITERKRAEKVLQETNRRVEDIVNSVEGVVWEADAQTFIFSFISTQAEQMFGYPTSRWLDEPTFWSDHIHPDDRDAAVRFCSDSTNKLLPHEFEFRMQAQDGRDIWIKDTVTVLAENGKAIKLRGIMMDITGRKLADE
ncbi:MAG: PAS domain S-box protein, partial [Pyrinomonadaceae bacterium]